MDKKLIYVAGLYGGKEENKQLIENVIKRLKQKDSISPHSNRVYISPVHTFGFMYEDTEYLEGLDYCLNLLDRCDECYMLSNWRESTGTQIEYGFCKAREILITFIDIDSLMKEEF